MQYFLAKNWDRVDAGVQFAFEGNDEHDPLGPGDWLVFEMVGGLWDLAQTTYSKRVYGGLTEHMLVLRAKAEEAVVKAGSGKKSSAARSERAKQVGYGGLEGDHDWPIIKQMHNDDVLDAAILGGDFNVLMTTSMTSIRTNDKSWPMFDRIGVHPEGEKHNIHRADTVMVQEKGYKWRTDLGAGDGKERGERQVARDVDFKDIGFVRSYLEHHREALSG